MACDSQVEGESFNPYNQHIVSVGGYSGVYRGELRIDELEYLDWLEYSSASNDEYLSSLRDELLDMTAT